MSRWRQGASLILSVTGMICSNTKTVIVGKASPFFFYEDNDLSVLMAFASDIDPSANDGHVFFRETMDQDMLDRATRDLEDGTGFIATWVFIATWHQVTYRKGNTTSPVREEELCLPILKYLSA